MKWFFTRRHFEFSSHCAPGKSIAILKWSSRSSKKIKTSSEGFRVPPFLNEPFVLSNSHSKLKLTQADNFNPQFKLVFNNRVEFKSLFFLVSWFYHLFVFFCAIKRSILISSTNENRCRAWYHNAIVIPQNKTLEFLWLHLTSQFSLPHALQTWK